MQHAQAKLSSKLHLFECVDVLAHALCSMHSDCTSKLGLITLGERFEPQKKLPGSFCISTAGSWAGYFCSDVSSNLHQASSQVLHIKISKYKHNFQPVLDDEYVNVVNSLFSSVLVLYCVVFDSHSCFFKNFHSSLLSFFFLSLFFYLRNPLRHFLSSALNLFITPKWNEHFHNLKVKNFESAQKKSKQGKSPSGKVPLPTSKVTEDQGNSPSLPFPEKHGPFSIVDGKLTSNTKTNSLKGNKWSLLVSKMSPINTIILLAPPTFEEQSSQAETQTKSMILIWLFPWHLHASAFYELVDILCNSTKTLFVNWLEIGLMLWNYSEGSRAWRGNRQLHY
ncbi:hypothetical protein VP01_38g1 [Puccinia sorghi]|uniref:Uncharacterized protein n=1 Tax=Puccinia sorghi TaxID=27349 RepID=A0A0L6UUM9_9BASI|nr:hypothetical protein VP01_38g1 [Puccinia sorghi]